MDLSPISCQCLNYDSISEDCELGFSKICVLKQNCQACFVSRLSAQIFGLIFHKWNASHKQKANKRKHLTPTLSTPTKICCIKLSSVSGISGAGTFDRFLVLVHLTDCLSMLFRAQSHLIASFKRFFTKENDLTQTKSFLITLSCVSYLVLVEI